MMDLNKADYGTIIKFGSLDDFIEKLKSEDKNLSEIINDTDKNGISLLQMALVSRKFAIAEYLISKNVRINNISNDGFNELHYLAANINYPGAIGIAEMLIDKGVDLILKDKKYGNPAFLSLCFEVLKKRTDAELEFIKRALKLCTNIDEENKAGISIRSMLMERGTDEIQKLVKVI